jgi:hypothetical protein
VADERGARQRPRRDDRPGFGGPRPFRPAPRPEPVFLEHRVRLREGDREVEVTGSATFVRQALDELPQLLGRLRGEPPGRPAAIRMPPPAEAVARDPGDRAGDRELPGGGSPASGRPSRNGSVEDRIVAVLRDADRPLAVAAIRKRLGSDVTPQQVRRALERAGDRVTAVNNRPATYRLSER